MREVQVSSQSASAAVPEVRTQDYTAGQTYKKGALLIADAAGTNVECGNIPTKVRAVALEGVGTKLGYGTANESSVTVATGRSASTSNAVVSRGNKFTALFVDAGNNVVVGNKTHEDKAYSMRKVAGAGGEWVIDSTLVGAGANFIAVVTKCLPEKAGIVEFKFTEAALTTP